MSAWTSTRATRRVSRIAVAARVATVTAVCATATLEAPPASADCPASVINCFADYNITNTTMNATWSSMCDGTFGNQAWTDFVIPAGSFDIGVAEAGKIDLRLRDVFTVTGPPSGSLIALHMRVRFHGYLNYAFSCCPDSQVRVALTPLEPQSGDPSLAWSFGKSAPPYDAFNFADSLDFTLQRTVGAPIGIEIRALSFLDGASSANLIGQFTFVDLPQGWTVTSCKGYREEQPVPAAPVSWGHVKATYR